VEAAFAAGADWLQLRDRELTGSAWLAWARELSDAAANGARRRGAEPIVLVNRRLDIALALGAAGAHLGFDALGLDSARSLLGPDSTLGVSAHTPEEVGAAAAAGADYAHLAPIFAPLSKPAERPALGTAALQVSSRPGFRVLAQGGIEPGNTAQVIRCGASGIAVTGTILQADDPAQATRALRDALDSAAPALPDALQTR